MSFDPRSIAGPGFWTKEGGWTSETRRAALARIDDPARRFVQTLTESVGEEPLFLRNAGQSEDCFIVFDNPVKPFAVQLDPVTEVVVVFDPSWQDEFGHWGGDRYAAALLVVQQRYLAPK